MSYVIVIDGVPAPYTIRQLREDNPKTSFPLKPREDTLAEYNVFPLQFDPIPDADVVTEGPIEERDGEWFQTYTGRPFTNEERAENAERQAERSRNDVRNVTRALNVIEKATLDVDTLSDEDVNDLVPTLEPWRPNVSYELPASGVRLVQFEGEPWVLEQAHTSQADWLPPLVPALWSRYRDPGAPPEPWQQLTPPDTYDTGDRVTHPRRPDDPTIWVFESLIDANTTEPGVDPTDRFWAPIQEA